MSACFENNSNNLKIVQYLVEHGADVNATRDMNFTSLMDASRKGYNDIVQYLLEKGADPELMDSSGRKALHSAARGGHFLVSKLLVETGVTMEKDNNGLTPLIEAAMNSKTEIVEYLLTLPECSRHDRIDAIELLGTSFMFKEHPYTSKTYSYFQKAMQEQYEDQDDIIPKHVVSEISVIFDTKECMSLIELAEIRDDELALKIEALAVQERILGLDHWQMHNNIMHSGIALRNMGDFYKSIELLLYGSKLKQKNDKNVNVICFPELFAKMFDGGIKIDFSSLLESFQIVVTEVKLETCRIQNGDTHYQQYFETEILACMYLVGIMLLTYTSKHEENQLYRAVRNFMNFIRQEPQFENEFNPLHMCCTNVTNDNKIDVCNIILFPNILLCQTLVACGADINARDSHHNTPLHIIAKSNISDFEIQREIIKCLIENGAHLDVRNTDDETAVDVSSSSIAEDFIKAHMKLSLKCLTARVIVNNGIEYEGTIPVSLYDFVELH